MKIAINDISFLKGFENICDAKSALVRFANVAFQLWGESVRNVDATMDIINSYRVNKSLELAPQYSLIQALNDIKGESREQYLCILQILTMVGEEEEADLEEFCLEGYRSKHCARYKDDFLLSIVSNVIFAGKTVQGKLNDEEDCRIKNIADESHIDLYWEELGFRLYELNPKHRTREYIRAGGEMVGIAPESDELGQSLLNHAITYKGKLFSVDVERNNRIFEFRHSYANKFHAFQRKNLSEDDRRRIIEVARQ